MEGFKSYRTKPTRHGAGHPRGLGREARSRMPPRVSSCVSGWADTPLRGRTLEEVARWVCWGRKVRVSLPFVQDSHVEVRASAGEYTGVRGGHVQYCGSFPGGLIRDKSQDITALSPQPLSLLLSLPGQRDFI